MNQFLKSFWIIIFTLVFCLSCFGQTKNTTSISELYDELANDEKIVAECERKKREYQIAQFGKVSPRISGHCWDGCPTNIVLPFYPLEAKRFGIAGRIKVETIVDESGRVKKNGVD